MTSFTTGYIFPKMSFPICKKEIAISTVKANSVQSKFLAYHKIYHVNNSTGNVYF